MEGEIESSKEANTELEGQVTQLNRTIESIYRTHDRATRVSSRWMTCIISSAMQMKKEVERKVLTLNDREEEIDRNKHSGQSNI